MAVFDISTLLGLKKIVAPRLSKYGFEYSGKRHSISWVFSRKVGDVTQFVAFEKIDANPDTMRFTLSTSVSRETIKHYHLVKEFSPFGLVYEDEASFYAALETLTDVIIERGIDWLTIMSRPDVLPSKETYNCFMERLENRHSAFIQSNNLKYSDSNFIETLEQIIRSNSNDGAQEPNWDFIVDAAIVLGEYVRLCYGGEWALSGAHQRPYLIKIGGEDNVEMNSLEVISKYWGRPSYVPYSIMSRFHRIQRKING